MTPRRLPQQSSSATAAVSALLVGLVGSCAPNSDLDRSYAQAKSCLDVFGDKVCGSAARFGAHIPPGRGLHTVDDGRTYIEMNRDAGFRWARYHILWWQVEPGAPCSPRPDCYQWPQVAGEDRILKELTAMREAGQYPAVILHGGPDWADAFAAELGDYNSKDESCRPIKPEFYDDFGEFAQAAVARYGHLARHWEIWNEEDAPFRNATEGASTLNGERIAVLSRNSPKTVEDAATGDAFAGFGCWGDGQDPSGAFGAARYAAFASTVYDMMKAVDPDIRVSLGGLLMGCLDDAAGGGLGNACPAIQFFPGVLDWVAANRPNDPPFDMVAVHAYASTWWAPDWPGDVVKDLDVYRWSPDDLDYVYANGGELHLKARFMRSALAERGFGDIPVALNEGGIGCHENSPYCKAPNTPKTTHPAFHPYKSNYAARYFTRGFAYGFENVLWYTIGNEGWRDTDLILGGKAPPAPISRSHAAATFATAFLGDTVFAESMHGAQPPAHGLEGYWFAKPGAQPDLYTYLGVAWTNRDDETALIRMPLTHGAVTVYDRFGVELGSSVPDATFEPVFLRVEDVVEPYKAFLPLLNK